MMTEHDEVTALIERLVKAASGTSFRAFMVPVMDPNDEDPEPQIYGLAVIWDRSKDDEVELNFDLTMREPEHN